MTEFSAKRAPSRAPTHPGELLREDILPALGKSKSEIARLLGVSRQTLYDVLDENQSVTPAMAIRLGKLCGNGPELWIRMQTAHDLWKAAREVDVSNIPTLKVA
jgi:addiction module HigA family antidote